MDELKDKFKNLLKGPSSSKKFQGQGHKLGTADAKPAPAKPRVPPVSRGGASSSQQPPRQELKPATEFSPFTAVIGGGAARTSNSMNPAGLAADTDSLPRGSSPTGAGRQLGSAGQPSPQQPQQQTQHPPVSSAVLEELQHGLALISSQPGVAVSSMQVLQKLLSNLLAAPHEAKFRQLRLGPNPNPKVQAAVLDVAGALDFLKACGFEVLTDEQEPGSQEEAGATHAYFLDDARLAHVEAGLLQMHLALQTAQQAQQPQQQPQQLQVQPVAAASVGSSGTAAQQASAAAAAAAPPAAAAQQPAPPQVVARNTLVLLPAVPDTDVPEFFFERTAAEVKAEFMSLLRSRQTKEVFASKAWKDLKLGATSSSSGRQPAAVTLRVRFPEGVCLQGCFGVREPVAAVFDWVTSSLRHPGLTYELITPSRTPLAPTGKASTVGGADLAGAVLNFRGLSHTQRGYLVGEGGRQLPFLSDALLARAQAD